MGTSLLGPVIQNGQNLRAVGFCEGRVLVAKTNRDANEFWSTRGATDGLLPYDLLDIERATELAGGRRTALETVGEVLPHPRLEGMIGIETFVLVQGTGATQALLGKVPAENRYFDRSIFLNVAERAASLAEETGTILPPEGALESIHPAFGSLLRGRGLDEIAFRSDSGEVAFTSLREGRILEPSKLRDGVPASGNGAVLLCDQVKEEEF